MKTIPANLQTHLNQDATTWCLLCRIDCKDGTTLGFTNLDAPVTYDDGISSITYSAANGFTPERFQSTADTSVDNTDLKGWVSDTGITMQQIRAGLFEYAEVSIYRVNYMNLADGHEIMGVGTCGETKFHSGSWNTEFRSLVQQLRQPISKLYSLTCRVPFGSPKCGKSFVWVSGAVTSVGSETDRIFTDATLTEIDGHFNLGVVEWLTGDNAGAQMEVDTFAADTFNLSLPMLYPISNGDTFRVRQDCTKEWSYCKNTHNNLVNFRGEHLIPIADAGANMVPGAQI